MWIRTTHTGYIILSTITQRKPVKSKLSEGLNDENLKDFQGTNKAVALHDAVLLTTVDPCPLTKITSHHEAY